MTRSPHRLIHASAGTGKTFQLSGRYLELLFAGVEPRAILATTFTRKAAGEIQERVLERLARAALEPEKRAELERQLGRALPSSAVEALLARLTRRLGEMRVRTLDAFFVHLARLFALELGLPSEWSIADDADELALRREAVARTLARSEPLELLVLLRGLQRAEASRTVEATLLREVEHGRSAYLESQPEAWREVRPPAALEARVLAGARAALGALPLPTTKQGKPRAHWRNAQAAILAALDAGDWRGLMELGLVQRVLADGEEFDREPIAAEWSEPIRLFLQQAAHEIVGEVARFNAAALEWLQRFEHSFEELKAEEHAYRFEDLPKALHPRDENRLGVAEDIWYRLDGRIDHLLLDEFQDTAPVQWRILAPLAEELLADGTGTRSFFCVGDLKQSIYGFREAEPRLLKGMHERHPVLVPEPLVESHRSSQIVLDTVDRVFAGIGDNAAFQHQEHRRAARSFQEDYAPHRAFRSRPGAAVLLEAAPVESAEEDAAEHATLRRAAERVEALVREAPGCTVGILLRRNKHIARTILLLRERGLHASGEGGNPLTDSAAVLHFLSLMHLCDHPGDSAAAFHVASSPLAAAVGLTREGHARERALVAEGVRARLAREGYGALAASLLAAVDAGYGAWDRRRFRQLVDLAHAHDERAGLRADRFVTHVRLTRVEDPAATQVQVMTVHSAKGLEFDAVLLPELDGPFVPQRAELLTQRPDPAGLITAVSRAPAEDVCRMEAVLDGLWCERERRELREALCLLYVAMTRARHRLEMIVQHRPKAGDVPRSCAGILRAALGALGAQGDGVLWAHEENHAVWFTPRAPAAAALARREPLPAPFRAARVAALTHRTASASEGGGLRAPAELLQAPGSRARLTGTLVHRWLREVEWLEDFAASDAELLARGRPLCADEELLRTTLREWRAYLAQPRTRAELARDASAEATVWRERAFSVVLAEPERALWTGAFDRVVLYGQPGAWERAVVLDFKTDRVNAAELERRVEYYRPQIEGYRAVLARMTGLRAERIEGRLLFLRVDEVRRV